MQVERVGSEVRAIESRVAREWIEDAWMEHASVATFARFTLELMAFGAPTDLVVASQQAGVDELRHAKDCFRIASRFAREDLGPGAVDVSSVVPSGDLARAAAVVIRDVCVGETLAALLAEARRDRARDFEVHATLAVFAAEEARHAQLGWDFLAWAIGRGGEAVRASASRAFDEMLSAPRRGPNRMRDVPVAVVRAHGLLDEATRRAVLDRALDKVIAPLASDLVRVAA
jgi:hypothetical protein